MRQQDVGDAVDAERAEVVEDVAVAEVDEHRLGSGTKHVDVARVAEERHAGRHRSRLRPHSHRREYEARGNGCISCGYRVEFRALWQKSSSTTSSKEFAGGVRAVDDVDLTIGEGEFMVLVGPSGCGKTTLLRSIGGLEKVTAAGS